jgi:integrase
MAIERRPNKDGTFSYRVRMKLPNNKWINGGTFADELDAGQQDIKLKKQLRIGEGVVLALEDGKKITVDEYQEVWRFDRRSSCGDGWWISKDQMYRDYVKPIIGSMKMNEVQIPHIARVLDGVREQGRKPQTVKHVYSLLRGMFGDAVEFYHMLERSPVSPKFHRPKVPKKMRDFLNPSQSIQLLTYVRDEAQERDRYLARPIWIQLIAGLRVEAIQGLEWKSILWDSNQILICRAWKQKEGRMEDHPKGKDWAYVPMVPLLRDYLWNEWLNVRDPEAYVCPGPKGGMLSYETYLRALKRMCRQARVPEIATQESRHSCTELWHQLAGANQEDMRRLLNHKSLSSTAHYIHRTEERLRTIGSGISLRVIQGGGFPQSFPNGEKEADGTSEVGVASV